MEGAPGIDSVAPCVCSDWTRCVFAFTALTASVGLGNAETAIGGGSPVLRRSHECDRQPTEDSKNQEPKNQKTKEPRKGVHWPFGSLVLRLLEFFLSASMRLKQFR